ncbi:MAG: hypothetical protein HY791_37580 [Deltaproteobacteria bacterium]|nr:hypothetical protein [Deltaproteobacteria bacterium]
MGTILEAIDHGDLDGFERSLLELPEAQRLEALYALPGNRLKKIWDLAAGRSVSVDVLIPAVESPIRYRGRNSMPLFDKMSKVFWRSKEGATFGYNDQFWSAFTGPGYFVAHEIDGSIAFDYTALPDKAPAGWPPITKPLFPIGTITFGNMIDHARWATKESVIGHATRVNGRSRGVWFLMTRVSS